MIDLITVAQSDYAIELNEQEQRLAVQAAQTVEIILNCVPDKYKDIGPYIKVTLPKEEAHIAIPECATIMAVLRHRGRSMETAWWEIEYHYQTRGGSMGKTPSLAMALLSMAFMVSWECKTGTVCHALLYHDSNIFLLCADGTFDLIEHGPDSWEIRCMSHAYMPMIGR